MVPEFLQCGLTLRTPTQCGVTLHQDMLDEIFSLSLSSFDPF